MCELALPSGEAALPRVPVHSSKYSYSFFKSPGQFAASARAVDHVSSMCSAEGKEGH